jgi:cytochrome oxidase Cu insertion factor (SCO1/SenC/PrrC family)
MERNPAVISMKNRCWSDERTSHFLGLPLLLPRRWDRIQLTVFCPTLWGVCLSLASFITGCASSRYNPPLQELTNSDVPVCCADPVPGAPKLPAEVEKTSPRPKSNLEDQVTITAWTQPGQRTHRFPGEIVFTTQEGKEIKAEDLRGRPIALSFLYTRCDNARKCPLVAATMARLQKELDAAALRKQVQLVLVTYDPDYDSPAVLTKFASAHGLRLDEFALMLQPESKQKDRLFQELNVGVNDDGQMVNLHSIQLMLFDTQGRCVRTYHSVIWNNVQVLRDLRRLLDETKQADNEEARR